MPNDPCVREDVLAAARVAVTVGCILTLVNHWDAVWSAEFNWTLGRHYALNCLVPFSVSLYSRRSAARMTARRALAVPPL
ncbi:MAG: nitrate/nitrite transporter NrtS [Gemmatimonadaceae bacterium]